MTVLLFLPYRYVCDPFSLLLAKYLLNSERVVMISQKVVISCASIADQHLKSTKDDNQKHKNGSNLDTNIELNLVVEEGDTQHIL